MLKKLLSTLLIFGFSPLWATPISFGFFADTPYTAWERENLPRLMAAMNATPLEFVIHAGDIKNSSDVCDDKSFERIVDVFQTSTHPLVYIPGDNEWVDCHHNANAAYEPVERLQKLRTLFFSGKTALGQRQLPLQRQSEGVNPLPFPENVRWKTAGVMFVALNQPGSSNNYWGTTRKSTKEEGPSSEFLTRSRANTTWLAQAFDIARREKMPGIVIIVHANPGFDRWNSGKSDPGYTAFLEQLRKETVTFSGEVVLLHGDTHTQRIDQPMVTESGKKVVTNFTRVEAFGTPAFGWIRIDIDLGKPKIFSFFPLPF